MWADALCLSGDGTPIAKTLGMEVRKMKYGIGWMAVGLVLTSAVSAEASGPQGPRQDPRRVVIVTQQAKKPAVVQQNVQQSNQQTVQQSNQQCNQQTVQQSNRQRVERSNRHAAQRRGYARCPEPVRPAPAPTPAPTPAPASDQRVHDDNGHGNDPGRVDPSNPGNSTGANGNGSANNSRPTVNHSANANNRPSGRNR
jgi:hypothetical protein